MIGQLLLTAGWPTVLTLSVPSRLTASPPPLSWPNDGVFALMVVSNVPPDPWVKVEPPLKDMVLPAWMTNAPLFTVVAPEPSCLLSAAARSTIPPAALVTLTLR